MKRNSLIGTIVPQNMKTEQAVKTGTIKMINKNHFT